MHFRSLFQSYMNERNTAQKEQFEPVYVVSIKMSNVGVYVCVCCGWGGGRLCQRVGGEAPWLCAGAHSFLGGSGFVHPTLLNEAPVCVCCEYVMSLY